MNSFLAYIWTLLESNIPKIFAIAEPIVLSVVADQTIPDSQKFSAIQARVLAAMEAQAIPIVMSDVSHAIAAAASKQQVDIISPAIQIGGNPTGGGPAALHDHGG